MTNRSSSVFYARFRLRLEERLLDAFPEWWSGSTLDIAAESLPLDCDFTEAFEQLTLGSASLDCMQRDGIIEVEANQSPTDRIRARLTPRGLSIATPAVADAAVLRRPHPPLAPHWRSASLWFASTAIAAVLSHYVDTLLDAIGAAEAARILSTLIGLP